MMKSLGKWSAKHPVISYYLIAFAISWGGVLVAIGGPRGLPFRTLTDQTLAICVATTLLGPPLAGLMMTAVVDGGAGLRDLASSLLKWRVEARWYAVALLTAPISVTVSLLGLSSFSHEFVPRYLSRSDGVSGVVEMSIPTILAVAVVAGLCEEIGWTGFAKPRMIRRFGIWRAGAFMGFFWGLWHLMSNLTGSEAPAGTVPHLVYMATLLFTFLPPYRLLMAWVYVHTESLLIAVLMHASLVTFWLVSMPSGINGAPQATWYLVWGVVIWIAVALVASRNSRGRSAKQMGLKSGME